MASLLIKDRINTNHMDCGEPAKDVNELRIEDFIPTDAEKNYVFQSLVCYFSSRLVERYPDSFKSIKSVIKPNKPHQFQNEMDSKSEEYTGELFTKSESRTEDLIDMMLLIQKKYVHTFEDKEGNIKCYEKKILREVFKTKYQILFYFYPVLFLLCHFLNRALLGKVSKKNKKLVEFSTKGGVRMGRFSTKKKK